MDLNYYIRDSRVGSFSVCVWLPVSVPPNIERGQYRNLVCCSYCMHEAVGLLSAPIYNTSFMGLHVDRHHSLPELYCLSR